MLSFFPTPHFDELFCDLGARYQDFRDIPSNYISVEAFFGGHPTKVSLALPSDLERFIDRLPVGHGYDAEILIERHTLLPLHMPFLPKERVEKIKTAMKDRSSQSRVLRTSQIACHITQPAEFQFCPVCVVEERIENGYCYFHRTHHVKGVYACPRHNVWLESTGISTKARFEWVIAERVVANLSPRPINTLDLNHSHLVAIAQDVEWVLNNKCDHIQRSHIQAKYRALLTEKGLASRTGHVFAKKLVAGFRDTFPSEILVLFDSELEQQCERNWLARITQMNQIQHPIRHLLLMRFLGVTAQEFFSSPVPANHPFGTGPWECLNPICSEYHQFVIKSIRLGICRNTKRRSLGTFECPTCGYTYSETQMLDVAKLRISKPKVVAYGRLWSETFRHQWCDSSIRLKDICANFQISIDTVHRQAEKLGLSVDRSANIVSKVIIEFTGVAEHRAIWIQTRTEYANAALIDLMILIPQTYNFLSRFDGEWLGSHKPPRKLNPVKTVDWTERDAWLTERAPKIVLLIKANIEKPVRITMNAVAKMIGWSEGSIQRDAERLPVAYG